MPGTKCLSTKIPGRSGCLNDFDLLGDPSRSLLERQVDDRLLGGRPEPERREVLEDVLESAPAALPEVPGKLAEYLPEKLFWVRVGLKINKAP